MEQRGKRGLGPFLKRVGRRLIGPFLDRGWRHGFEPRYEIESRFGLDPFSELKGAVGLAHSWSRLGGSVGMTSSCRGGQGMAPPNNGGEAWAWSHRQQGK